jgi:hypothetical protein
VQMPDTLVVCFTLNNQSVEGAAAVAHSEKPGESEGVGGYPARYNVDRAVLR